MEINKRLAYMNLGRLQKNIEFQINETGNFLDNFEKFCTHMDNYDSIGMIKTDALIRQNFKNLTTSLKGILYSVNEVYTSFNV